MNSERYNKIIKCTLNGINSDYNYIDSYVLVKDIDDLDSELNIDLKGGLCFNTDYNIEDIENIMEIKSLEELYDFCRSKEILLDSQNVTDVGLLVGADSSFLILKDLNAYGWISDGYIENNTEREKVLNEVSQEIQKKYEKPESDTYKGIFYSVVEDDEENKGGYRIQFFKDFENEYDEVDFENMLDFMVIHVENDDEMRNPVKYIEEYINYMIEEKEI